MIVLDTQTVIISTIFSNAICVIVMASLWFHNRRRIAGSGYWLAGFVLQFTGILLVALRGSLPDFVSMTVSSTLIVGGALLLFAGLEFFVEKTTRQTYNIVLVVVFLIAHAYFVLIQPSPAARSILLALALLVIFAQCAWLLLRRVDAGWLPITRNLGLIFIACCLVSAVRIFQVLVIPAADDFLDSNIYGASLVMISQLLLIALTSGILLLVNRRLTDDLERDKVELKHLREELRSSRKRAEVLYESAPGILVTVNGEGRITRINDRAQAMFGYTCDELLDQPIEKIIPQSLPARLEKDPDEHLRSLGAGLDVFAVRKDGSEFPAEIGLSPLQIDGESFVTADIRDISERKQMKESLYQRNSVLEALHQTMLYLVDRHDVGDILETLLAVIRELLKASPVSIDLIEDNDVLVKRAATADQPLKVGDRMRRGEGGWLSWQAIDSGRPAVLEDYAAWQGRREPFEGYPIHAIAIVPIHQGEQVIGAINCLRSEEDRPFSDTDIYVAEQLAQMVALVLDNARLYARLESELADRKRMDETLRESRENFQRYFNMGTVGMCVTSPDMKWIETNGHLRKMLGYTDEELDQLTWRELTHPEDLDADLVMFNQVLANERDSYRLDKRFIRKDGETVYTTMYASCYRNPDGTVRYLLSSLVDITDRKEAEAALLKLTAVEERQRMARNLHDSVNQSIHSLVLFSETLTSTLERNNIERARQIAERMQESARQALKETRLLLYETQATAPQRSMDLIQALEARLATVEQRAGVRTQIVQDGSLEHCPQAWSENLFWITIEALNNALKHAQARNMKILMTSSPQRIEMEIIDDGIGFNPGKPRAGGLGLRNMRERAELSGGELVIRSAPGKGTRVCFRAEIKVQHGQHSNIGR